jgi:hypothetical protein
MRVIAVISMLAACGGAAPVIGNRVAPVCGAGDEAARTRIPDGGYVCRLRIDEHTLPWFPCDAVSSDEYSVLQWSTPARCRLSGILHARRLDAEVSCRTSEGELDIVGTTELRAIGNGWEAEVDMAADVQRGGDDTRHRVAIFVCRTE